MMVVLTLNVRRFGSIRRYGRVAATAVLLLAMPAAPAWCASAGEPTVDDPLPLEDLASTIGDLTTSLSAIRRDLAAMRDPSVAMAPPETVCAQPAEGDGTLARELHDLRARVAAERAAWHHAEAAMTGELTGLRERLAAANSAVAELHADREVLVQRIGELDELVEQARTREVVDALAAAERPAIEPAEPAPPLSSAASLMRIAPPALAAEALPALKTAANPSLARAASRLDLQAELALAQLRIAELTTALDSARVREEAMEAEVVSLRSLTEAQIRRIMGRE